MKIVVTGGAGFIGSHLIERLVIDGHDVASLDNYFTGTPENHIKGAKYVRGDSKNIRCMSEVPDIIYHLGEYARVEKSFEDIRQVLELNIEGTINVLEYCRENKVKLVYAGSSTKFADGGMGRDQSPYAWTKATNTDLVRNYGEWFGLDYAITYFYNVYGPRERHDSYGTIVGIYKERKRLGKSLKVVSPGTQRRNFTHVKDVINGLVKIGESGSGDEYGLGAEESYSILELAEMFGGEIEMLPERKGNRMNALLDTKRTRQELGWKPTHSLKDYISSLK